MVKPKFVSATFRKLEQAFTQKKDLRDGSVVLGAVGHFIEEMKGPENAIGEILKLGHADAMDPANKRLRHDWAKLFLEAGKLYDTKSAETMDLDGVDEDDLKAIVTKVAIELIANDKDFRHACLIEAIRSDPNLLEDLNDDASLHQEQKMLEAMEA